MTVAQRLGLDPWDIPDRWTYAQFWLTVQCIEDALQMEAKAMGVTEETETTWAPVQTHEYPKLRSKRE